MLTFGVVVLGADDVPRAVAFWQEALGYELVAGGLGGWANVLAPPGGAPGPRLAVQRSGTPPPSRPRLHLDLHVTDAAEQRAEAGRLVALGARRVAWDSYPADPDFVVLADPEGNLFCVVDLTHGQG